MTPENWAQLQPLFARVLELKSEERSAFIASVALEDRELGFELGELVRAHEESTCSLDPRFLKLQDALEAHCFSEGELVVDRFRIVRFIGRGGMGEVYEAFDKQLGRVALKTIRPDLLLDEQAMQRFRLEVQLARKITSPLVSRVHELFTVPAGPGRRPLAFLTMEYLDGITLADRIRRDGRLEVKEAESIALQLCSALEAIHSVGVVHRDLKPGNIMLVESAGVVRVVVMDLGLARHVEGASSPAATAVSAVTRPGVVLGTPEFMAPEQFECRSVTAAADIYAFGLVFYSMLTGQRPFQAASPIATAVRRARRLPPASAIRSGIPKHWDKVIDRCLEYEPEQRFQNAGEITQALRTEGSRVKRFRRALGRRAIVLMVAVLITALLIPGAIWYFWVRPSWGASPEAMRWFELGSTALREATYVKATRAFERAVSIDPDFALAHAGLADAWAELDFTGKAQDEMLRASSLEMGQRLTRRDGEHIDAVRAMRIRDFQTAQRDYAAILEQATPQEKAWSYVDLGRAYEKAGDATKALESYGQAARLALEEPAAFVRLGILESRQGKMADAETHFKRAEFLYNASSNREGIAEIDYQRGYAASVHNNLPHAREFLNKSLHAARDIPSVQLEIRALIRLGVVEDLAKNMDQFVEFEKRARELAIANKVDYWGIDALFRLGGAYQYRGDYAKAEPLLQEAVRLAHESQMARLEANGHLALASMRDQQGMPDETIALARAALDYYRKAGFAAESVQASILIGRSEWTKGELKAARAEALQALQPARNSASPTNLMQVEELLGGVLLDQQEYPEALRHLQYALQAARTAGEDLEYQQLHCADALWRLGRYREADELLASIPHAGTGVADVIEEGILDVSAQMSLSRGDARGALERARKGLRMRNLPPEYLVDYENVSALSLAALHSIGEAQKASAVALEHSAEVPGGRSAADSNLVAALVNLSAGLPNEALRRAETALAFFSNTGRKESEFRSLVCIAKVMKSSGDPAACAKFSTKALDILADFEHNWGTSTFQTYISRRDLHSEREQLLTFAHR
jgi:tetratricopeptide (TPR) repeat protein